MGLLEQVLVFCFKDIIEMVYKIQTGLGSQLTELQNCS